MLFFIILSIIFILSIVLIFTTKKKEETFKKFKTFLTITGLTSFTCLLILTIVVCGIQFSKGNSHEAIEKERVYLSYKVENNEYYNTDVVSRIDDFNKSIESAKKHIKNPWIGCFYTKAHAETEPIIYEIIIIDTQKTTTAN